MNLKCAKLDEEGSDKASLNLRLSLGDNCIRGSDLRRLNIPVNPLFENNQIFEITLNSDDSGIIRVLNRDFEVQMRYGNEGNLTKPRNLQCYYCFVVDCFFKKGFCLRFTKTTELATFILTFEKNIQDSPVLNNTASGTNCKEEYDYSELDISQIYDFLSQNFRNDKEKKDKEDRSKEKANESSEPNFLSPNHSKPVYDCNPINFEELDHSKTSGDKKGGMISLDQNDLQLSNQDINLLFKDYSDEDTKHLLIKDKKSHNLFEEKAKSPVVFDLTEKREKRTERILSYNKENSNHATPRKGNIEIINLLESSEKKNEKKTTNSYLGGNLSHLRENEREKERKAQLDKETKLIRSPFEESIRNYKRFREGPNYFNFRPINPKKVISDDVEIEEASAKIKETTPKMNKFLSNKSWLKGYSNPSPLLEGKKEEECIICLGEIKEESKIDSCRHSFCSTCIWYWSSHSNQCPLCKKEFKKIITWDPIKKKYNKKTIKKKSYKIDENDDFYFEEVNEDYCEFCMICNKNDDENNLLICDLCNYNVCHIKCANLDMVPDGNWYCLECQDHGNMGVNEEDVSYNDGYNNEEEHESEEDNEEIIEEDIDVEETIRPSRRSNRRNMNTSARNFNMRRSRNSDTGTRERIRRNGRENEIAGRRESSRPAARRRVGNTRTRRRRQPSFDEEDSDLRDFIVSDDDVYLEDLDYKDSHSIDSDSYDSRRVNSRNYTRMLRRRR